MDFTEDRLDSESSKYMRPEASHYNHRSHGGRIHKPDRRRNNGSGIPDRWLNYDAIGRDIEGTRFVPFKTPLDKRFFHNNSLIHEDDHWQVDHLLDCANKNGKRFGLIIDLTNTDRYYNKTEWATNDIKYIKLNCPGHEVNQREDIVEQFFKMVDDFIAEHPAPDSGLIGVHCTHGLNRTGYLICRYMIDRMGWSATDAISQFELNRGHPIERGHYKKSLYEAERRRRQRISQPTPKSEPDPNTPATSASSS